MTTILDSRDLLTELRDLVGGDELNPDADVMAELDEEDRRRVDALNAVLDETGRENTVEGRNSWGVTMIPEDEFTDYAKELADDIGAIGGDAGWPQQYINWDAAADALKADYDTVEFDGVTYYWRA